MLHSAFCVGFAALAALAAPPVQPAVGKPEATPDSQEHLEQLQLIREGLLDPDARPVERQRWAASLLAFDTPQAKALTVELLNHQDMPDVQRALCGVIGDRARRTPERLDPRLIAPLIELLGSDAEDLRMMAAHALADFSGSNVPETLGVLAAQTDAPLAKRLGAIDALAPNTHRREVVGQLIRLLDAGVPEITERVVAALEPVTTRTFGNDVKRWRTWWEEKSKLSEEAWLAEQVRMLRDRGRRATDELEAERAASRQRELATTARVQGLEREVYRALSEEERDAKLTEWLADDLPEIKRGALAIIKSRIADEGKRPSGEVLTTLLALLKDGSVSVRREVLEVVRNLTDPVVVQAVLERLEQETDVATRQLILIALGQLDDAAALPALIHEIDDPHNTDACVREAAIALGLVAGKADTDEIRTQAAEALNARYLAIPKGQPALRAALLNAMARVADASFAPALLDAVESDDAAVLREAIHGLRAIQEVSKLPRIRTLTAHADPLVRLEAIEAVGQLGREDADLERLLTRLNPKEEPNERVRDAAWQGFQAFASRRPLDERIQLAERLRDTSDLEAQYLETLVDNLTTSNDRPQELESLLDRLITILMEQGRYAEAVPHLRSLYGILGARDGANAWSCGLRLLEAMLRGNVTANLAEFIPQLAAKAQDASARARIIGVAASYLEPDGTPLSIERRRAVLTELRAVPADALGVEWTELLDRVETRLEADASPPAPKSPPSGP